MDEVLEMKRQRGNKRPAADVRELERQVAEAVADGKIAVKDIAAAVGTSYSRAWRAYTNLRAQLAIDDPTQFSSARRQVIAKLDELENIVAKSETMSDARKVGLMLDIIEKFIRVTGVSAPQALAIAVHDQTVHEVPTLQVVIVQAEKPEFEIRTPRIDELTIPEHRVRQADLPELARSGGQFLGKGPD